MESPSPSYSPLGPLDRVSFFEAQQKNRRASWRFTALSLFTVGVMGMPLSLVLTPLLYGLLLLLLHLTNLVHPLPSSIWSTLESAGLLVVHFLDYLNGDPGRAFSMKGSLFAVGLLLLPGILLLFALWLGLRVAFRRQGVEGLLKGFEARNPNKDDLEEMQLANVAEEMAIAGGLPSLPVKIVDSPSANAAALGLGPADATLVVSQGLLRTLDREETQAVMAHFVASVGNGDLKIAWNLLLLFKTYGLVLTLLNAPFGPRSRETLKNLFLLLFSRRGASGAEDLSRQLTGSVSMEANDDFDTFMDVKDNQKTFTRKIREILSLPLIFANLSIRLTLFFCVSLILGPALGLLWRSRRYLADSEAIQLTRDPDGLARALTRMGGSIPGGEWQSHLFIVKPAEDWTHGKKTLTGSTGAALLASFHPALNRRLKRLKEMGAHWEETKPKPKTFGQKIFQTAVVVILTPLFLLLGYLILIVIAMMIGLNFMFMSLALAAIHAFFQLFH